MSANQPIVPLSPALLPQQRIYEVMDVPGWPSGVEPFVAYPNRVELDGLPKRRAHNAIDLCQVEWAWSPMNGRVDAYCLSRGRRHWLLWLGALNDSETPWRWDWSIVAGVHHRNLDERVAAQNLLRAFWMYDRDQGDCGRFHWINSTAYLEIAVVRAIARSVWGDG
jgi:hypothetical protein